MRCGAHDPWVVIGGVGRGDAMTEEQDRINKRLLAMIDGLLSASTSHQKAIKCLTGENERAQASLERLMGDFNTLAERMDRLTGTVTSPPKWRERVGGLVRGWLR